jgi:hypothetical protein
VNDFLPIEERVGVDVAVFLEEIIPAGRPVFMRSLVSEGPEVEAMRQGNSALAALGRPVGVG